MVVLSDILDELQWTDDGSLVIGFISGMAYYEEYVSYLVLPQEE